MLLFKSAEFKHSEFSKDIDPDNYVYSNLISNLNHVTQEQLEVSVSSCRGFSMIHFNARSLKKNFDKIEKFILYCKIKFDAIAVSENWLTQNETDQFTLRGYEVTHLVRKNKGGGGVSVYVANDLSFKICNNMTKVVDELMECLTVEICNMKANNILFTCVYRKPGSCITMFIENITQILSVIKNSPKTVIVGSDFNIDILNYSNSNCTRSFVDFMFAYGMFPVIQNPSRVTDTCATLIDNFYVNVLEYKISSGLLVNDTSDHLPIFAVLDKLKVCRKKQNSRKYIRTTTDSNINLLRVALNKEDWNNVCNSIEVNTAYEVFVDKCCTISIVQ